MRIYTTNVPTCQRANLLSNEPTKIRLKSTFFIFLFFFIAMKMQAQTQTLVLNGSFEQGNCPNAISQINRATSWSSDCGNPLNSPDLLQYAGGSCPQFPASVPGSSNNIIPDNNPANSRYMALISSNTGNFNESGMGTLSAPLAAGTYLIRLKASVPRTTVNQIPVGFTVRLIKRNDCTQTPMQILSGTGIQTNSWQIFDTCFDISSEYQNYYDAIIIQREQTFMATQTECAFDDIEIALVPNISNMPNELTGNTVLNPPFPQNQTYTVANPIPGATYTFGVIGNGTILPTGFPPLPPNSVKIKWNTANADNIGGYVVVTRDINTPCGYVMRTDSIKVSPKCTYKDTEPGHQTIFLNETSASAMNFGPVVTANVPTLFVVNGTFVIDQDLEFANGGTNRDVQIIFNPNGKMLLKGKDRTLKFTGVGLSSCICCEKINLDIPKALSTNSIPNDANRDYVNLPLLLPIFFVDVLTVSKSVLIWWYKMA